MVGRRVAGIARPGTIVFLNQLKIFGGKSHKG
jgi:hypothetical protein